MLCWAPSEHTPRDLHKTLFLWSPCTESKLQITQLKQSTDMNVPTLNEKTTGKNHPLAELDNQESPNKLYFVQYNSYL